MDDLFATVIFLDKNRKITNMIVQLIAKQSFYSISNMDMKTMLNLQFSQMYKPENVVFPFQISVLSLTINYPPNSFPVNNTLGIQLLKSKSLLSQLTNQYDSINAYITANSARINSTYVQNVNNFVISIRQPCQHRSIVDCWEFMILMIG